MTRLAHVGEVLALYARVVPDKIGASDLERKMTFRLWHSRACRLANAFAGIGLRKGDRVCEALVLIVQDELLGVVESIRDELPGPLDNFIHFGVAACPAGYRAYRCTPRAPLANPKALSAITAASRSRSSLDAYTISSSGGRYECRE
jgi:hypothetical protein